MTEEIWMPVPGYEGIYIVSSYGKIKRIHYKGKPCDWVIRQRVKKNGYCEIGLRDANNKRKFYLVHRLVGIVYVPNPLNLPQINHDDTNKQNNYYENLKWVTPQQNIVHSWEHGMSTVNIVKGNQNGKSKLKSDQVIKIKELLAAGYTATQVIEKLSLEVKHSCIYHIKHNRNWT